MKEIIPIAATVMLFLIIVTFLFAAIAKQFFAFVKIDDGDEIGIRHANFRTFNESFRTMIRCMTGEAWPSIMFDTGRERSILYQCIEDETFETYELRDPDLIGGPQGCGDLVASVFVHFAF